MMKNLSFSFGDGINGFTGEILGELKRRLSEKESELVRVTSEMNVVYAKLNAMEDISKALIAPMDFDQLLDILNVMIFRMMNASFSAIYLLDESRGVLELKVIKIKDKISIQEPKKEIRLGEGIEGMVAKTNTPKFILNSGDTTLQDSLEGLDIKSRTLCVPLDVKDRAIGVIKVSIRSEDIFRQEDLDLLCSISNQAAIAIENTRLVHQLERKINELDSIIKMTKIISAKRKIESMLEETVNLTKKVMKAEAASLMLLDERTKQLRFEVAQGPKGKEVKQFHLQLGEGIAGWVAQKGEPVLVNDVRKDERFFRKIDEHVGFQTRSILCAPLKIGQRIIGIIEIINKIGKPSFSEEDLNLFVILSEQVAIALENLRLYNQLKVLFLNTIGSFARSIDAKSPYTHKHSERVSKYALAIADEISPDNDLKETIELAGILHDIGKIGIPDSILEKSEPLTLDEYKVLKNHPLIGAKIMDSAEEFKEIIPGIKYHHEFYDGSGYPEGIKGDNIPLVARVICIADSFDAMTSERPYRTKLSKKEAVEEIKKYAGIKFDPEVVDAFLRAYTKGKI
jgi:putative nucleotidyltransferase with HDIG domain